MRVSRTLSLFPARSPPGPMGLEALGHLHKKKKKTVIPNGYVSIFVMGQNILFDSILFISSHI